MRGSKKLADFELAQGARDFSGSVAHFYQTRSHIANHAAQVQEVVKSSQNLEIVKRCCPSGALLGEMSDVGPDIQMRDAGDGLVFQVLGERSHHSPIELFSSWPIVLDY